MILTKAHIKNFKSIRDSGEIIFSGGIFVLAGQNESGKSSILEALQSYSNDEFDADTLNFEEEQLKNFFQYVGCTYELHQEEKVKFAQSLCEDLESFFEAEKGSFDSDKLSLISTFTIGKTYDQKEGKIKYNISDSAFNVIKSAVNMKIIKNTSESGKEVESKVPCITLNQDNKSTVAEAVYSSISVPGMILFNDFSDLLPDEILISDLESKNTKAKGYKAVKNIEKIIGKSFTEMSKLVHAQRNSTIQKEISSLSINFQKDRNQRIYENGKVILNFEIFNDKGEAGEVVPKVFFYVETKDGVFLQPRKRSKGMIRFLSAWLELRSREKGHKLVILYDEPGLFLHIKAHKDILKLFKSLAANGHQIIYSTHSPSLIDSSDLSNIGLVLNTERQGTIVEDLTTSKIDTQYKRDALQPIANAMGLEPLLDFGVFQKNNIILEGISDFWYFQAMKLLIDKKGDYKFVPGIGIQFGKIHSLISFCIGYGLNRLLVMDDGPVSKKVLGDLKNSLFNNEDAADSFISILQGCNGIEHMFDVSDLKLTGEQINSIEGRPNIANKKAIISKKFFQKVNSGKIKEADLYTDTLIRFKEIFKWINTNLKK